MTAPTPVLFIHGLWLHATVVGRPGSSCSPPPATTRRRPGWPGEPDTVQEARANPDAVADHGIDDVVDALRELIAGLPAASRS